MGPDIQNSRIRKVTVVAGLSALLSIVSACKDKSDAERKAEVDRAVAAALKAKDAEQERIRNLFRPGTGTDHKPDPRTEATFRNMFSQMIFSPGQRDQYSRKQRCGNNTQQNHQQQYEQQIDYPAIRRALAELINLYKQSGDPLRPVWNHPSLPELEDTLQPIFDRNDIYWFRDPQLTGGLNQRDAEQAFICFFGKRWRAQRP